MTARPYRDPPPETPNGVRAQRWYQYASQAGRKLTHRQFFQVLRVALRALWTGRRAS